MSRADAPRFPQASFPHAATPAPTGQPVDRPRHAAWLLLGLCAATIYSYLRGQRALPEWAGEIYYVIDYSDGLIRRGLIGQLFLLFYNRTQAAAIWAMALTVHRAFCFGIMAGVLVWFWSLLWTNKRFSPARLALIYLIFAASQFYPTLAATNTYLDAYVFALLLGGFVCVSRHRMIPAFLCGFIGPFIHDLAVLLWISLIVMLIWRDGWQSLRRPTTALVCAAPFMGQGFLALFESHAAIAHQLAIAPVSKAVIDVMMREQMGHTILGDLAVMRRLYLAHPARAAISIIGFSLPSWGMVALAARAVDRRATAALILATMAPLAVLILEYDLSRFTVATQFVAMLSILFVAAVPGELQPASASRANQPLGDVEKWLGLPCAAVLLLLPLVYGYFGSTRLINNDMLNLIPGAGRLVIMLQGELGTDMPPGSQ